MPPSCRFACIAVSTILCACDAGFLHDVPSVAAPNDTPCTGALPPTSVLASWSSAGATLAWQVEPLPDAAVVVQRRAADGVWGEIGRRSADVQVYVDSNCTTLNAACTYRLIVATSACQTQPSDEATAYSAPVDIEGFSARGAGDVVNLAWASNNIFADGYTISRGDAGGEVVPIATLGVSTSYVDQVTRDTAYCYRIHAHTPGGDGPDTEQCTKSGAAALSVAVSRYVGHLVLDWGDVNQFETGVVVRRNGVEIATLAADTVHFDDIGLQPNIDYAYELVATSAHGDSAPSLFTQRTIDPTMTPTINVTNCSVTSAVSLAADTGAFAVGADALIEIASDASANGGAALWQAEGTVDASASVGSFDTYWNVVLSNFDSFAEAFTHRLFFSTLDTLVGTPTTASYAGEGLQPWPGDPVPACGAAFGTIASISTGRRNTCARTNQGRVVCWGEQSDKMLGSAVDADSVAPHGICSSNGGIGCNLLFLTNVSSVSLGDDEVFARMNNGQLRRWGVSSLDPSQTDALPQAFVVANMKTVAAGGQFACGVTLADQKVMCWGENTFAQLGRGSTAPPIGTPGEVCTGPGTCDSLTQVRSVATGTSHACVSNGEVYCWGDNAKGQAGAPLVTATVFKATKVASALTSVVQLAAGTDFTCAANTVGAAWCFGSNLHGALGYGGGTTGTSFQAQQVVGVDGTGTLGNVVALAAGDGHACALQESGRVACWGNNAAGQLGNDTHSDSDVPRRVQAVTGAGPLESVAAIAAGRSHTCAVLADASVVCWGDNARKQLGNPLAGVDSAVPVPVICDGLDASCGVRPETMYRAGVRGQGTLGAALR